MKAEVRSFVTQNILSTVSSLDEGVQIKNTEEYDFFTCKMKDKMVFLSIDGKNRCFYQEDNSLFEYKREGFNGLSGTLKGIHNNKAFEIQIGHGFFSKNFSFLK